jgi:BON domain
MRTRFLKLGAALAILLAACDIATAQGRTGGTSAFGSSGFGSSGFGSSGFGSSGFGSSGMGRSGGFGSSGFGASGFGSSGFGGSGFGNSSLGRGGSSGFGNSGFGSGQFGGGQNFVGRDAADMQNTFSQTSKASTQFFNNMNRQMARNNRRNAPSTKTSRNPQQVMRTEVQVAFTAQPPGNEAVASTLRTRLAKILADHHMTLPTVTMQGDTVVVSGAAASDGERQVIGQLVSLEPGVRAVRNEMTVAGEPTEGTAPPPGS